MHRVSGVDAAFLYGETPTWHMHVCGLIVVDPSTAPRPFSAERLKRAVEERLDEIPQFRWKLREVPLGLDRPVFTDDPDFDLDYHVRRIAVPAPGRREELGELVGDLCSYQLDRSRPLWEMWVIEGLDGGGVALLSKVHHSIVDGVTGAELATVLLDMEPDPPPRKPAATGDRSAGPDPSNAELMVRGLVSMAATPFKLARYAPQLLRQGRTFISFASRDAPPAQPFQAPRTSFNRAITPHRRFVYTQVSLADVKAVKNAAGVKLNDVVLAICAGALRRYLEARSELPDQPLIAQVPVSTHTDESKGEVGTRVSAMFASLCTDIEDPAERLRGIYDATRSAKEMHQALSADRIMGLSDTTPPGLIAVAARTYTAAGLDGRTPPIFNLIISNVPGPPIDLYAIGAKVKGLYPMGPLLYGSGINITVLSSRTHIDVGAMVCQDIVPDPWFLVDGVPLALEELHAAVGAKPDGAEAPDRS